MICTYAAIELLDVLKVPFNSETNSKPSLDALHKEIVKRFLDRVIRVFDISLQWRTLFELGDDGIAIKLLASIRTYHWAFTNVFYWYKLVNYLWSCSLNIQASKSASEANKRKTQWHFFPNNNELCKISKGGFKTTKSIYQYPGKFTADPWREESWIYHSFVIWNLTWIRAWLPDDLFPSFKTFLFDSG